MASNLRHGLRGIYPELADVPFSGTRMCWYCDTPNADWLIDHHPDHPGLIFATGGSGHAYKVQSMRLETVLLNWRHSIKFLPVIGSLVKARLEGQLDVDLGKRFAFQRDGFSHSDLSRASQLQPILLREEDLLV
jgi:sarcosine oxidase/L-pipecolate oxidase